MTDTASPTLPPSSRRSASRHRHGGHVAAIVIGCLLLLPSLGLLAGGASLAVANGIATDDDGYFSYSIDRVRSEGVAVATTDLWFDEVDGDAPWLFDWLDVDLRFRIEGAAGSDEVFVGIARAADVEAYFDDVAWSEVVALDDRAARYRQYVGSTSLDSPLDQDFWVESISGPGEQELEWAARGGRWSVVVMNADGSPGVTADVELGARSGVITPVAIGLLVSGVVMLAGSIVLIVFGARGRRDDDQPSPSTGVGDAAAPSSPEQTDVAWRPASSTAEPTLPPPVPTSEPASV